MINFNDLLNDPEIKKEAELQAQREFEDYKKKREEDFKNSQAYKQLRKAAIEKLKKESLKNKIEQYEQEFKAEKTRIEEEFNWNDVKFEPIEGLPNPEEINTNKTEAEIEQIKETAKENAPKSGRAAYDKMKDFYDSDIDSAIKDKVRFLPSDEALVYVEMLNEGLTPEEIEEKGFKEIKPENEENEV